MPTYYFDLTNDIVIARDPMVAAAFYGSYYKYITYSITILETPEEPDKVATFSHHTLPSWQRAGANIYLEPVGRHPGLPEGTVQQVAVERHMRVSSSLFSDLLYLAPLDCEYPNCGYDASNLYYDILLPLGEQILLLDDKQLGLLANAIRRDFNGDMVRSLLYLMDNYSSIYKDFIYPVIVGNHEEAHLEAERQFRGC